jgi:hypothetical protein
MRFIAIVLPLLVAACSGAEATENVDDGATGTRNFNASGFERVRLSGSDDVRVISGAEFAVSATGPEAVLDRLDIRVDGDTLIVGRDRKSGWSWSQERKGAVVTVTMPVMRGASLAGSGDMSVATTADDRFEARLAGSGNLDIADVRAAETKFSLAGSGDMRAKGKAANADYSLAGSGDIDGAELLSETVKVSVAGSGDVSAHASGKAEVRIVGSGDVTISGTKDCVSKKLGSGEVRCI